MPRARDVRGRIPHNIIYQYLVQSHLYIFIRYGESRRFFLLAKQELCLNQLRVSLDNVVLRLKGNIVSMEYCFLKQFEGDISIALSSLTYFQ